MKISIIPRYLIYAFLLLWLGLSLWPQEKVKENVPPLILSCECGDRLFSYFIQAIQSAQNEIHFVIYALTDKKVIDALNQASERGVKVKVIYDPKTEREKLSLLSPSIEKIAATGSALMHRKLLVIDQETLFIGSANGTAASLRLHHNLVLGMKSKEICQQIIEKKEPMSVEIGGQYIEFYLFPEERAIGLSRLLSLIENAKESLVIAMFTWTYPPLTEAVIRAHQRGVDVQVILDRNAAGGSSRKTKEALVNAGIPLRLGPSNKLLHHKFLYVDKRILATGSSNWTKAAFHRNQDCLMILHDLTKKQQLKMEKMNKIIRCMTEKYYAFN